MVLDTPSSIERELAAGAVRSKTVSPLRRFLLDRNGYKRDFQNAINKEVADKASAATAPDGSRDITNYDQQKGLELNGWLIAARLKKLNPSLWFEVAKADETRMGVYYLDPTADEGRRFICGMEREATPEFSVVSKDSGIVVKSGWRRLLAKLIRKGFITESGAAALFGPPSRDSQNWKTLTQ